MDRRCSLLGLLLLLHSSVVFQTYAVDVELKDKNNVTCLIAKWKMNISVIYETKKNEHKEASFALPNELTYDGSTCGNATFGPVLDIEFGEGNSWMITFDKTKGTYQGNITFIYNTDDVILFPDAERKGPRSIYVTYPDLTIPLNSSYTCQCAVAIESDNVIQTFWNVTMQAYVENNSLSDMVTQCHEDKIAAEAATPTITTVVVAAATTVPVTAKHTTIVTAAAAAAAAAAPIKTTAESAVTTTSEKETTINLTTAPPRPLPTVAPGEKPAIGNYSVKSNGTTCLLANMGVQLNVSRDIEGRLIMNINPSTTAVSGSCSDRTAVLQMNDDNTTMIDFVFAATKPVSGKFYLKEVNITVMDPFHRTQIRVENGSLDTWKARLGSSYMCQRQQTIVLSQKFSINIFEVWVQPFLVKGDTFATADECLLDDDAIIIPIAVGAALAALIVLIVIAYIIGRRKSQVGYQTL